MNTVKRFVPIVLLLVVAYFVWTKFLAAKLKK